MKELIHILLTTIDIETSFSVIYPLRSEFSFCLKQYFCANWR